MPVTGLLGALVVALLLLVPGPAAAEVMCDWFFRCLYESPGFRFRVVDGETKQPLADVHALAEWVLEGAHGRNGPLMVQDAASGADGSVKFPAWGPTRGPRTGLVLNLDPAITLFKPGYKTRLLQNSYPEDTTETTRVRRFGEDGGDMVLEPFRGKPAEWVEQLRKAVYPATLGRPSEEQLLRFRTSYLNRVQRVWIERDNSPTQYRDPGEFFWHVERDLKFYEGGRR
jgi:hypothetical protein